MKLTPSAQRIICGATYRTMAAAPCPPSSFLSVVPSITVLQHDISNTTWRQDPHVPSATCPVPNGLSRGRSFRRSLSILRSPHPQQRQERPWWILEQRPTGVPGAVPNGTPSRHESRRRPRLPVARDGPKRLETSRDVSRAPTETGHYRYTTRNSYSLGHRATDDSESGMGLPHQQATKVDPTWEDKHLAITGSSHYN